MKKPKSDDALQYSVGSTKISTRYLKVKEAPSGDGFELWCGSHQIATPAGCPVTHNHSFLLQHMVEELQAYRSIVLQLNGAIVNPAECASYTYYEFQKDRIENQSDKLSVRFTQEIRFDPWLVAVRDFHRFEEQTYPDYWQPILEYLGTLRVLFSSLFLEVDSASKDGQGTERDQRRLNPLVGERLHAAYNDLPPHRRAVVRFMHKKFDGVLILPLMLASGRITPAKFAASIIASMQEPGILLAMHSETSDKFHKAYDILITDARTAVEYIQAYEHPDPIGELIKRGESKQLEFKSTLRWNIKANRNDDAITHSVLKTIAAFLNTDGGTLLIGIDDDGELLGIELDNFPNADKYLLHLTNVLKHSLGEAAAASVGISMEKYKGKTVCKLECPRSETPVFLTFKKTDDEEFYVRTGPASTRLQPRQLMEYVPKRFQK